MNIELTPTSALFHEGKREAGRLVLNDPFKPYLHPLRSPDGHLVSVAMPGDHRHHKGLMYALRCADLNFWEETPGSGQCGVEEILCAEVVDTGTIRMELLWREEQGHLETYRERREIACQYQPGRRAFVWTWRTRREALRDHRLIKSEWSLELADGRRINYHGLGIRLPWGWGFDGCHGLELQGRAATAREVCGSDGPEVTWWGRIDGQWHAPRAAVTVRQQNRFTWFVINSGFPYLSIGPSNAMEVDVRAGQQFGEAYVIEVSDLV